jgi:hypothetical protein
MTHQRTFLDLVRRWDLLGLYPFPLRTDASTRPALSAYLPQSLPSLLSLQDLIQLATIQTVVTGVLTGGDVVQ